VRIYTRKGDRGETSLRGGLRVPKTDARVEACGACDELNALLGLAAASTDSPDIRGMLFRIQSSLFSIGAEIAAAGDQERSWSGGQEATADIERAIDGLDADLPPLTTFVLPGGIPLAALLHVARAVCRRAERALVAAGHVHALDPAICAYVNRLSDFLFVLARWVNHDCGVADVAWKPQSG
jgi:cob(I)alamin adenosyltransferase